MSTRPGPRYMGDACNEFARHMGKRIVKALPAGRGPLAATKDVRRAVRAALVAQRSQYGPPTGRRNR